MKNHHAGGNIPNYPEISTASVRTRSDRSVLRYTFNRAIGTKG